MNTKWTKAIVRSSGAQNRCWNGRQERAREREREKETEAGGTREAREIWEKRNRTSVQRKKNRKYKILTTKWIFIRKRSIHLFYMQTKLSTWNGKFESFLCYFCFFYVVCVYVSHFAPDLLYLFGNVFSFDDFDAMLYFYLLLHSEQAMPRYYPGLETSNFICVTFSALQQHCLWHLRKPTVNKLTKFKIHHSKSFASWIIPTAKIPLSYQISWYIHRTKLLSNGIKLFRSIRHFLLLSSFSSELNSNSIDTHLQFQLFSFHSDWVFIVR